MMSQVLAKAYKEQVKFPYLFARHEFISYLCMHYGTELYLDSFFHHCVHHLPCSRLDAGGLLSLARQSRLHWSPMSLDRNCHADAARWFLPLTYIHGGKGTKNSPIHPNSPIKFLQLSDFQPVLFDGVEG